jgi:hypothetical protein
LCDQSWPTKIFWNCSNVADQFASGDRNWRTSARRKQAIENDIPEDVSRVVTWRLASRIADNERVRSFRRCEAEHCEASGTRKLPKVEIRGLNFVVLSYKKHWSVNFDDCGAHDGGD